jgi:hypothetical protein
MLPFLTSTSGRNWRKEFGNATGDFSSTHPERKGNNPTLGMLD